MARRTLDLPQDWAYALVTAVRHHGLWIPFTRVSAPRHALRAGDVVVGRTAGLLVDRMRVTHADPPHQLRLVKTGPLLLGEVVITVQPRGPLRALVTWTEDDVHLRGPLPPALTATLVRPALETMTTFALWRIGRSVRRRRQAGDLAG